MFAMILGQFELIFQIITYSIAIHDQWKDTTEIVC
jgi:hypothetical protein